MKGKLKETMDETLIRKQHDRIKELEEEINKLTAESTEWESKCYDLQKENERLNKQYDLMEQSLDGKQEVIDEAIEYIEEIKKNRKGLSVTEYKTKWRSLLDYYESNDIMNDLLNILQGSDE